MGVTLFKDTMKKPMCTRAKVAWGKIEKMHTCTFQNHQSSHKPSHGQTMANSTEVE